MGREGVGARMGVGISHSREDSAEKQNQQGNKREKKQKPTAAGPFESAEVDEEKKKYFDVFLFGISNRGAKA